MNNELIEKSYKLIHYVINKQKLDRSIYDDLYQEGCIGLIKAANSYNKNSNIKFSTYAYICIRNEILMYLRKNKNNYKNVSLNKMFNNVKLEYFLSDGKEDILDSLINAEVRSNLFKAINEVLTDREKIVIVMSFGLDGIKHKPSEIENIIQTSQAQVSRIKKKALFKLQQELNDIENN